VTLVGTLALRDKARLDELLATERDRFAAIEEWERHTDLTVIPDDADFADLDLAGYAAQARDDLRALVAAGGDDAEPASEALGVLVRLAARAG